MSRAKSDPSVPFQSPVGTARITGLSVNFIRAGCRDGTIPHIRVGNDVRVNVPLFLEQLNRQSQEVVR